MLKPSRAVITEPEPSYTRGGQQGLGEGVKKAVMLGPF